MGGERRDGIAGWFESLGAGRVVCEFSDIEVSTGGDLAALSAMIQYSGDSPEGAIEREMANRLTWTLTLSTASGASSTSTRRPPLI